MSIHLEEIDEKTLCEAEEILDQIGLDITTAIKMMLKKITNEKGVSFMLTRFSEQSKTNDFSKETAVSKMTKNKAIYLFRSKGYELNGNVTFASKNKSANCYWANPDISVLSSDWYLILNDCYKQALHLFFIPNHSISSNKVVIRNDKKNQIDLQIMYDDHSFTDTRSKICFKHFMLASVNY